jgi:hypothetical protein
MPSRRDSIRSRLQKFVDRLTELQEGATETPEEHAATIKECEGILAEMRKLAREGEVN